MIIHKELIEKLEKIIGYEFNDKSLLLQAVTHSSYSNEQKINKLKNYERLEFLGDAVLELISSEFLFVKYESIPEGKLTKLRASLVCEPALAYCAGLINLSEFLLLGKGEEATGGRGKDSINADVMEAIIGALYLDNGLDKAKEFVLKFILSDIEHKQLFYDSKTILQEYVQSKLKKMIIYELVSESGPEHDKQFSVRVLLDGQVFGEGEGKTKKAAEQQAAYAAIRKLEIKAE